MQLDIASNLNHADIIVHQQPAQLRIIDCHCCTAIAAQAVWKAGLHWHLHQGNTVHHQK
jgi:hypothetical protein